MRLFSDSNTSFHDPYLRRALTLAEEGRGTTSPNPMVGCVLVRDDVIVGEGYHARAGEPHAEVIALGAAGKSARGATAYVTLEPCNHFGKTPPCSEALIAAGVAKVVIGMPDPTRLAGGGAVRLQQAGVEVEYYSDPAPFIELNEAWVHYERTGRPYVHAKVALSLDGHPTGASGVRAVVSGPGGSQITMRVRGAADAVVVGAATALVDEPALTLRDSAGMVMARQPLRVVLGFHDAPDVAFLRDGIGNAIALVPQNVQVPHGVTALRYDGSSGLSGALETLGRERGVRRVLVETGPRMFTALLAAGLIDELTVVHAGGVFGSGAPPLYVGMDAFDPARLSRTMRAFEAGVIEGDAVTVWRPMGRD